MLEFAQIASRKLRGKVKIPHARLDTPCKVDKMKCKAKARTTGKKCKNNVSQGREVCYMHGGASLQPGPDHPRFKTGIYSAHLPSRLIETYEAGLADPERASLDENISLVRAIIIDLLKRLYGGESGGRMKAIRKAFGTYRRALSSGAPIEVVANYMNELETMVNRGWAEFAALEELGRQIDRHARLVTAETKRQQTNAEMMAVSQVVLLFVAFTNGLRSDIARHTKGETRRKILDDVAKTANRYLEPGDRGYQ